MRKSSKQPVKMERPKPESLLDAYGELLTGVVQVIEQGRIAAARSVNVVLTSTYWLVGQRIIEHEQSGAERAAYGKALLKNLAHDLTTRLGRGFSERNLEQMRAFYLAWPNPQTLSAESKFLRLYFRLPWSHYVRLLSVADAEARAYYEREALQGGWSVRQLDRQIATLAYQRTGGRRALKAKDEALPPDAYTRDPFILEFLNLKDEYSETDLENALIDSLEQFLLELGSDFAFVARQKRLRIGTEWYRVDLVFFHRQLRCLIIVDLKAREIHSRRCRSNEPVLELRARALDAHTREPASWPDTLLGEGCGRGALLARQSFQRSARARVPVDVA